MSRIAVIGGTGYAGRHIVEEAVSRGHDVVAVARQAPADPVAGATYVQASLLDVPALLEAIGQVDVVFETASPRDEMAGRLRPAIAELAAAVPEGTRLGVVGGAGGCQVTEGGPLLVDTDEFPDAIKPEAREMIDVLGDLEKTDGSLDWFFIHPAAGFGAWAVGERTGSYRTGGKVLVTAEDGSSTLSGADFAVAVLDEIENPRHRRTNFSVGY